MKWWKRIKQACCCRRPQKSQCGRRTKQGLYVLAEGANVTGNFVATIAGLTKKPGPLALTVGAFMGGIESLNKAAFQVREAWVEDGDESDSESDESDKPPPSRVQKFCQDKQGVPMGLYISFSIVKALLEVYFEIESLVAWCYEYQQDSDFDGNLTPWLGWRGVVITLAIALFLRLPFDFTTDVSAVGEGLHKWTKAPADRYHAMHLICSETCLQNNAFRTWIARGGSAWHVAEHVIDVVLMLPAPEIAQVSGETLGIVGLVGGALVFAVACITPTAVQNWLFEGKASDDAMRAAVRLTNPKTEPFVPKTASAFLREGIKWKGPLMHAVGTAASVFIMLRTLLAQEMFGMDARYLAWSLASLAGTCSAAGYHHTESKEACRELEEITVTVSGEERLTEDTSPGG